MTTTIEFNKRHYHLNSEMEQWCKEHIGAGGWVYSSPDAWHEYQWAVSSMFGNTTFFFRNSVDATAFLLKWT